VARSAHFSVDLETTAESGNMCQCCVTGQIAGWRYYLTLGGQRS
jgi:hypothetical protein